MASGVVAASGLHWLAQAGISAAISAGTDADNQITDIVQTKASIQNYNIGQTFREAALGFATSAAGSGLGSLCGRFVTKTQIISDQLYDQYLEKTFNAALRKEAGKSSSALLRQAGKLLDQSDFYGNVTRGVSSGLGSAVSLWRLVG